MTERGPQQPRAEDRGSTHTAGLSSLSGNPAFLATLQDNEVVYIDKMETHNSLRKYSIIGQRALLYCTALGKSMLISMAEDQIRKMYRGIELKTFTHRTITNVDDLVAEIEKTRCRGWSVDDEEYEEGLRCIGAPIRDYRTEVIGAVNTSGYASVITRERVEEIAAYVVKAARDISQRLGYRSQ